MTAALTFALQSGVAALILGYPIRCEVRRISTRRSAR